MLRLASQNLLLVCSGRRTDAPSGFVSCFCVLFFFLCFIWFGIFLKSSLVISDSLQEEQKKKKHTLPLCSHFEDSSVLNSFSILSESFRKPRRTSVQYFLGQEQVLYLLLFFLPVFVPAVHQQCANTSVLVLQWRAGQGACSCRDGLGAGMVAQMFYLFCFWPWLLLIHKVTLSVGQLVSV